MILFRTSLVESVIEQVLRNYTKAMIIMKSIISIGYTKAARERYHTENILFSPEFLREGHTLYYNLYSSRIIVGVSEDNPDNVGKAHIFADLLQQGAEKSDIDTLFTGLTVAGHI